jgi:hypothetical protein
MGWREEFPKFDPDTMPDIPLFFDDWSSWDAEGCPHFVSGHLELFVDFLNPEDRQDPEMPRFTLHSQKTETVLVESDDWDDVCNVIAAELS